MIEFVHKQKNRSDLFVLALEETEQTTQESGVIVMTNNTPTSINNNPNQIKKGICDGFRCSRHATDTIDVKAGNYVISLNLCKNCVYKVSNTDH